MKKINNKTRIRVSISKIFLELKINFWDFNRREEVMKYMYDNFDMKLTSKRIGLYYFSIGDKAKYSLFLLKHSDLIRGKNEW